MSTKIKAYYSPQTPLMNGSNSRNIINNAEKCFHQLFNGSIFKKILNKHVNLKNRERTKLFLFAKY